MNRICSRAFSHVKRTTLGDVVKRLDHVVKRLDKGVGRNTVQLKEMNQKLEGFIGNSAKSNETEIVESVRQHLIAEGSRIKRSTLDDVVNQLKAINKKLDELIGNPAKSNQTEIVESVFQDLIAEGSRIVDVAVGHKVFANNRVLCEFDGFITTDDCLIVVEAKSTVTNNSITQLANACKIAEDYYGGPVVGFLGGPNFPEDVKQSALKSGFSVVELSGDRFRVVKSNDNDDYKKATA
jgi:hypothetical protein